MFGVLVTFVCLIACSGERAGLDLHIDGVLSVDGKYSSLDEVITYCAEFGAAVMKEQVGSYGADLNTVEKLCQSPIIEGKLAERVIVKQKERLCPEFRPDGAWFVKFEEALEEDDGFMAKFDAAAQAALCEPSNGARDFESLDEVVTHCADFGAKALQSEMGISEVMKACREDGQTIASTFLLDQLESVEQTRLCPELRTAGSTWMIEAKKDADSFVTLFNAKMSASLCSMIGDFDA